MSREHQGAHGRFDQGARYLARHRPTGLFGWLVPAFTAVWSFRSWLDTSRIAFPGEPDRVCDTVAEFTHWAERGRRCVLDAEFQAEPEPDMLERLGECAIRIRREIPRGTALADRYPVLSMLLNLTGPPQADALTMSVAELGGAGLHSRVVLFTLREMDAEAVLAQLAGGAVERCVLPWIPLKRGVTRPVLLRGGKTSP